MGLQDKGNKFIIVHKQTYHENSMSGLNGYRETK